MDERLKFVARLLDGEKMAVLCREFEISRKTGYKIFQRYKDCGLEGLTDRSRRPYRHARQLPFQIEKAIVQLNLHGAYIILKHRCIANLNTSKLLILLAPPAGVEPTTYRLGGGRSIH